MSTNEKDRRLAALAVHGHEPVHGSPCVEWVATGTCTMDGWNDSEQWEGENRVAALVAGAREIAERLGADSLATLRAENEALRKDRDDVKACIEQALSERDTWLADMRGLVDQRDAAKAELAAVKAELERMTGEAEYAQRLLRLSNAKGTVDADALAQCKAALARVAALPDKWLTTWVADSMAGERRAWREDECAGDLRDHLATLTPHDLDAWVLGHADRLLRDACIVGVSFIEAPDGNNDCALTSDPGAVARLTIHRENGDVVDCDTYHNTLAEAYAAAKGEP